MSQQAIQLIVMIGHDGDQRVSQLFVPQATTGQLIKPMLEIIVAENLSDPASEVAWQEVVAQRGGWEILQALAELPQASGCAELASGSVAEVEAPGWRQRGAQVFVQMPDMRNGARTWAEHHHAM